VKGRDPRSVLREAGLFPKKSFGQNFLVADGIARRVASTCVLDGEVGHAHVVEIGAGTGVLTLLLAERAAEVVAIERDRELVPHLARALEGSRARVLEGDALDADLETLLGEPRAGSPRVLCGNLPYSITGALLRRAVEHAARVERVVFMVQDEVAHRLCASPGTKEWGALSVFVRAAFEPRRAFRVPPGAFHPAPEVTSAVVELKPIRPPRAKETETFRTLVRRAFEMRRKTLRNAWAGLTQSAPELEAAAAASGIALQARGETLDVEAFVRMAAALDDLNAGRSAAAERPSRPRGPES
jgi:16S rRNA (adenine1518-N6/adenine1519-N6)-dimethyltransferase